MSRHAILVTGGSGLVGTNLVERLEADGHEVVSAGSERDLRDANMAQQLLAEVHPEVLFHLAARVGGIYANATQKPDFYRDNVLINTHVLDAAVASGVRYVFAMGTGCAYPKRLEGSLLREEDYLDGIPEETNDAYAYAKRGMLVHLEALREHGALDYCYCLPANLYGPHDNFHPDHSHVVPGLIRRFVEASRSGAREVVIWGDGSAERDFLYIGDCVDAMVRLADREFSGPVNVATGTPTSIRSLAETIRDAASFSGTIGHDLTKPAGQMGRLFDTSKVRSTGWSPTHDLTTGIERTVAWFREHPDQIRSY
jgi:GDP-L-fucose synthase